MDPESQPNASARSRALGGVNVPAVLSLVGALALVLPLAARAQAPAQAEDTTVYAVDPVIVTATRGPRAVSATPRPVVVFQPRDLRERMPNSVPDLFRMQAGLDVTGVGVSQVRPQIRGQGGQRILLLNDGLRMNNTRRQNDFGELPSLIDMGAIDQVEIIRGPASVLYGSDAIGGVVNIVTKVPDREGFSGTGSYLFGSAGQQSKVAGRVQGRTGSLSMIAGGSWRTVDAYEAPSGSFGDITLDGASTVIHSGVEDYNFDGRLGFDVTSSFGVFGKVEHYRSDDSGFGFVSPADYQPGAEEIDITYPMQSFTKLTAGATAQELDFVLADYVSVTAYGQDNERDLHFDAVFPAGPGASVTLANRNYTDIRTYGFRAEARKLLFDEVLLTYGVDGFEDNVVGTDNDTTTIVGFGPPMEFVDDVPSLPDADLLSLGFFAQAELELAERVSVVGGGRFQSVSAETFATPSVGNTATSRDNSTLVGAVNLMVEVADGLDLITSVGRGFRSPNLVELFFEGVVAEGDAYQLASADLEAETSLNVDVGARYQNANLFAEVFLFRNKIYDGIRGAAVTDAAGDTVQTAGFDTYQDINVDEIRIWGYEVNVDYRLDQGIEIGATYAHLDAKDELDEDNPVGQSYSRKFTGRVGYRDPAGRFWGQFEGRYSGEQKEVAIGTGNPLGDVLPAFQVYGLRGGLRLPEMGGFRQSLTVAVNNLFDELYAETANASFFRPEPKRSVTVSLEVAF